MRRHPLLEELFHAVIAMTVLVVAIAAIYWLVMGEPPLGFLLGGTIGFLFGIIILTITSPARR
jgi:hypothetical protein